MARKLFRVQGGPAGKALPAFMLLLPSVGPRALVAFDLLGGYGQTGSSLLQLRLQLLGPSHRRLAGKIAAHVACGLPINESAIPQERHSRVTVSYSQSHHLEGPLALANHVEQSLRVSGVRIADDSNLPRL